MGEHDVVTYPHDTLAERPLKDLVAGVGRDMGLLVRQEIQLAKVEISEKVSRVAGGAVSIGVGAMVVYAGVLAIVAALVLVGIAIGVTAWLASAIIGVLLLIGGFAAITGGKKRMVSGPPPLQRTKDNARDTVAQLKEQLR
jgi:uncharacterized membrane protein YqjE